MSVRSCARLPGRALSLLHYLVLIAADASGGARRYQRREATWQYQRIRHKAVKNRTFGRDGEFDDGIPRLQEFAGIQPLRSYLGGPLFAILQDLIKDGMAVATRPSSNARAAARNLRLAD